MTSSSYEKVRVPLSVRFEQLLQSLLVLRDSVNAIDQGSSHPLLPLSGQLRALLVDKAKGGEGLLLELAAETKQELKLFCLPATDAAGTQRALHLSHHSSVHREFPEQEEVALEVFLDRIGLAQGGEHCSIRELIEFYANKAGGAHFASKVERRVLTLLNSSLRVAGLMPAQLILTDLAKTVLHIARRMLTPLFRFTFDFNFAAPLQKQLVLLDGVFGNSNVRLTVSLNDGRPEMRVTDVAGTSHLVGGRAIVDSATRHTLTLFGMITERYEHEFLLVIDGLMIASVKLPNAISFFSPLNGYTWSVNRRVDFPEMKGGWLAVMDETFPLRPRNPDQPIRQWCALTPDSKLEVSPDSSVDCTNATFVSSTDVDAWLVAAQAAVASAPNEPPFPPLPGYLHRRRPDVQIASVTLTTKNSSE